MTCKPTKVASMNTNSIDQNSVVAIWRWTITQVGRRARARTVLTFGSGRRLAHHERPAPRSACPVPGSRHHRAVDPDLRTRHFRDNDDVFRRLRGLAASDPICSTGTPRLPAHDAP